MISLPSLHMKITIALDAARHERIATSNKVPGRNGETKQKLRKLRVKLSGHETVIDDGNNHGLPLSSFFWWLSTNVNYKLARIFESNRQRDLSSKITSLYLFIYTEIQTRWRCLRCHVAIADKTDEELNYNTKKENAPSDAAHRDVLVPSVHLQWSAEGTLFTNNNQH